MADDYKKGTPWSAKTWVADSDRQMAAAHRSARAAKCANGEHEPTVVPATRAVYAAFGRRRETGDRYCIHCDADLPAEDTREDAGS